MGKITPRFFLAVFIFGLCLLSANTVLANINYGPEKPISEKQIKETSYFVGFLLEEAPTIIAPEDKTENNDSGECYASSLNLGTPTIEGTNNSPELSVNGNNIDPSNYEFQVGVTTVTWTITNDDGTDSDTQTITITDNERPVISHNGDQSVNSDSGQCGATVSISATASDNCNVPNPTATRSDGQSLNALYPVGTTTITWNVTDENNNDAETVTQTITVTDNERPVISHNGDQPVNTDSGQCGATVSVSATATDNCNVPNPTATRSDGQNLSAPYPVGVTTITWNVTDENGKDADPISQTITVTDSEKPVITHNGDQSVNTDSDQCGATVSVSATAADNCNVPNPTATRSDGQNLSAPYPVGVTTISWDATDENNNEAETLTQTITVTDSEKPVITHNGDQSVNTDSGQCGATVSVSATATDNCNVSNPTATRSDGQNLSAPYPVGVTTISWDVTDENSNDAQTVTQTITVTDNEKPVITHNGDQSVNTDSSQCGATVSVSATATDNCNVPDPTATRSDGQNLSAPYPVGVTTISWDVTDENNNEAQTVTQTITVTDNEKPVITHNGDKNINNDAGECGANVSVSATATDNCSVGNPTGTRSDDQALTALYPTGTTTITWTVTDENGIPQTSIQTIIVKDKEAPIVPTLEENITWGCEFTVEAPVASDNCDGEIAGVPNRSTTFTTSGDITWTFTDSEGNSTTASQEINIIPLSLNANNITVVDVLCNGLATGEVEAQATGGVAPLKYDWGSLGIGAKKTNLPAGNYSVTVTDANNCEVGPVTVTVNEPDTFIEISETTSTSGCFGANNGTATVQAQGGTGAYTYLWDDDDKQTTQTATDLAPGSYSVTVTDANGCSKDRTITVSSPTELEITGFLTTETTSFGSATGSATAQVTGGSGGFTFQWSDGESQTGQTANSLLAGEYTVTVTDSNGCTATDQVTVVDSIEANIVPISLCKNDDLIRTSTFSVENLTARGGTAPYTYSWDFGENASPAIGTGTGPIDVTYENIGDKLITLTVKDSEGREFKQSLIQYVGGCFSDDCGSNDLGLDSYFIGDENKNKITSSNCSTSGNKYIYINFPTNATRYSLQIELIYSVEDINTGEIINHKVKDCFFNKEAIPKVAQTFPIDYQCGNIVKVEGVFLTFQNNKKDECGTTQGNGNNPKCFSTNNEATVSSPLFGVAFPNELLCNGSNNGSINVRASGGTGTYTFELKSTSTNTTIAGPQASNQFNELPGGTYNVVINDGDKTFTTAEVEIQQPSSALVFDEPTITNVVCFGGENGSATVNATGGTPNSSGEAYIYVWSNGQTGTTATNLSAGEYTVTVTDANGCQAETVITIDQPDELLADAGPDQVLGCGINSTNLAAVFQTDETTTTEQTGTWTIVNGPAGGSFAAVNDPATLFTGDQGTYTLRWSVTCGKTDDVKISFQNCSTLDFDGQNDHINLAENYGLESGDFTLEAWIKPKSIDGVRSIISKRDYSNLTAGGYDLVINNGVPEFRYGTKTFKATNAVNTSRWFHIAIIKDGSDIQFFIDGIADGSATGAANPAGTSAPMLVGAIYDASTPNITKNQFHGWIEELRIWKKPINKEQLRFMMNQRIKNDGNVKGEIIPLQVPGGLQWTDLSGYYRLIVAEISGGITLDRAQNKVEGKLININTSQENTAPLPYISKQNGSWRTKTTWLHPDVWDTPNSLGINDEPINWNIVRLDGKRLTNAATTDNSNSIILLGFLDDGGSLIMNGDNNNSGNELRITHYLKLDGLIDLNGESQLVQTDISDSEPVQTVISVLDEESLGYIERDQQGTASSYNYNYWSSPVMPNNTTSKFTVAGILKNGLKNGEVKNIQFGNGPFYVEQNGSGSKINISNYWINGFFPNPQNPNEENANQYHSWKQLGSNPTKQDFKLFPGEGFTMKGTTDISVTDAEKNNLYQTYIFNGFPNNGTLELRKSYPNQNYLIGNPYPSAVDANEFIDHNEPYINGAIYYWHHFAGKSHYLAEYIGGYATYSKALGLPAKSIDSRIDNSNPNSSGGKRPGRYIPVAQGFFVNTSKNSDGPNASPAEGVIEFTNRMRVFAPDTDITGNSDETQFLKPETKTKEQAKYEKDTRYKIRLNFNSPQGYWRQIGVTADGNTTQGIDYGYEALLIDRGSEDMYWVIGEKRYVIQGVPHFNLDQILPLGITIADEKEFSIELGELENVPDIIDIYLRDNSDSTYHDLRKKAFKASLPAGEYQDLYEIVFHDVTSTRKDKEPGEGPIDYYYSLDNREFVISNPELHKIEHINIYNIAGQLVDQHFGIPDLKEIHVPQKKSLSSAVYIVKVYTDSGDYAKKVIIRKD